MVEAIASFGRDDRPDAVRLVVVGDLDDSNREDWYAALARLITDATGSAVVDLTGVTFFGSAGIGSLVAANNRAYLRGVHLVVWPSWMVQRVLQVAGLTNHFDLRRLEQPSV